MGSIPIPRIIIFITVAGDANPMGDSAGTETIVKLNPSIAVRLVLMVFIWPQVSMNIIFWIRSGSMVSILPEYAS